MTENDQMRIAKARNSFTGKNLSDTQFDESWALAGIVNRAIQKTGSFYEKLEDYSHAFARGEKFDQVKGKIIIRDIFKARYGQTMNQMREGLKEREASLPDAARTQALDQARQIEPLVRDGDTMPFYRAYEHAGRALADTLNITETGAKDLMKSTYNEVEGRDLYDAGKAVEKQFHDPVREAEREAQRADRKATRSKAPSRTRA